MVMEANAEHFAIHRPIAFDLPHPYFEDFGKAPTDSMGVSVVIPAYNEERRLPQTLATYLAALEREERPYEIIVVVDGVTDRTAEVARSFAHRGVRVLEFSRRLGKGGAIKAGVDVARYDCVGYVDADGPVLASDLVRMVNALPTCDAVIASRWVRGSHVVVQQPISRVVMGRVWNALTRSLLLLPVKDTQCGAKFFRRSVLTSSLRSVSITNWAFDAGLLFHLRKKGYFLREVPVTWNHADDSRLNPGTEAPKMFLSVLAVRVMSWRYARWIPKSVVQRFQQMVND